jgi:hypothetical protein
MSGQFDKFAWFKAVYAESRFTSGEKAVLAHIAVINVLNGKGTFCVRQSTIAGQCGITRRTVSSAITRGKRFGYLGVSRLRTPGRSHHGADELRLLLPKSCEESSHYSDGNGEKQPPEWCEASSTNGEKQTTEWCEAPNASSSGNDTPNSSGKQFSEDSSGRGGSRQSDTSPDQPPPTPKPPPPKPFTEEQPDDAPSKFCERHPVGTTENCRGCGDARLKFEAWKRTNDDRITELKATIRAGIDNCDQCDDYGRLDDQSDCPKHLNFRQLRKTANDNVTAVRQPAVVNELIARLAVTKGLPA